MAGRIFQKWTKATITMLKSGMGRKQIVLCIVLGFVLGIFPVLGATTVLCTVVATILRLNLPAMQLINYLVYPIQLALLTPFYSAGIWFFNHHVKIDTHQNLVLMLKHDLWGSLPALWDLTLYAIFIWAITCPVLFIILYCLIKPAVTVLAMKHKKV